MANAAIVLYLFFWKLMKCPSLQREETHFLWQTSQKRKRKNHDGWCSKEPPNSMYIYTTKRCILQQKKVIEFTTLSQN